ncbi:TetR family transcriptional regulator [Mycolicibacterium mageritense DSM 44476 = CIP 104973]|uniref:HTH-type transcriptional regulator n=1 Tax=Mycolicibacterium mageritense TaxID=53462 RepID=A0AAI8XM97_MYCME|nr:TetR/AcrR family transcriptional regulator [Mycolicibacterium mageritense]MBN3456326.1 TetR/AcrR family transcriptional regulator [Mycobacterium sp. DSM 3803]OKH67036.1 TetR family transcriptional regulator [Mycobacterium sp. SWH-M3]MCC9181347.1 TetR/AcrR family transcriptional regulator [Mycolicibacterium mageritense]TXI65209.1 MAG: TetR/AcrR family transcriptional regulator [Mycolicibacterium mageritense]CDO22391.1 HTH-type transcriptional regulator [Mycolicibacterium mageritense DSM 4447
MARTQQQRREETVARLLDAGIETIIEVGYAKASAAVIARRAKVSDGALFRHFPTMSDFMAATAQEVARRQLELGSKLVAEIPADQPPLPAVLTILRDIAGSDTNTVWHELMMAARTDEKLRGPLQTVLAEYIDNIYETAKSGPGMDQVPEDVFAVLLTIVVNTFDGAAMVRRVLPLPELEEARIAALTELLSR